MSSIGHSDLVADRLWPSICVNLYETEPVLKPVNLNSLKDEERVPSDSDKPPYSNEDVSLPPKSPNNEQVDNFSASDSDLEEEVDSALETTLSIIRPTRLGRITTLTRRMTDVLQVGMTCRNVKWQQLVT